ncbi:MAG: hypothetical protein JKX81_08025 [Arenicella sp.]|nr:hypothetical protein [Arenicella sp.]
MFSIALFSVLTQASALLLAGIFLGAGLSKLNPENAEYYREAIANYGITPRLWSARLVGLIGALELGIAVLIILPRSQFLSLIVAAVVLSVYAYAFIKIIREGRSDIDCGCAGPGGKVTVGRGLVVRNVILIVLALVAAFV